MRDLFTTTPDAAAAFERDHSVPYFDDRPTPDELIEASGAPVDPVPGDLLHALTVSTLGRDLLELAMRRGQPIQYRAEASLDGLAHGVVRVDVDDRFWHTFGSLAELEEDLPGWEFLEDSEHDSILYARRRQS